MKKSHLGHTARKRFGQNFLKDDIIIDKILNAIGPKDSDFLLEIGPGLGALTEPMCERIDQLTVIELDRDLAKRLRHHPFHANKLTVLEHDALAFNFSQLAEEHKSKIRVFGNLPYNISTPLMFHLFSHGQHIVDMHFMLQKEVVDRLSAKPGNKLYGRLSVMAQYYCDVVPVLAVPPESFIPAPKVESSVVRLKPHISPPVEVKNLKLLEQVCSAAFNQKRKTIRNSLSKLINAEDLKKIQIDPSQRAERLSLNDFAMIANSLSF